MNIENELKLKAYNIDFFTKKAVEDITTLGQYSDWLLNQANQIQMEMEMLREMNKKLEEALEEISRGFDSDSRNYSREQMMRMAKEALN
jgi:hypothetical protein